MGRQDHRDGDGSDEDEEPDAGGGDALDPFVRCPFGLDQLEGGREVGPGQHESPWCGPRPS